MKNIKLHKDICIRFEFEGVAYEAIGFLNEEIEIWTVAPGMFFADNPGFRFIPNGKAALTLGEVIEHVEQHRRTIFSEVDWKRIYNNRFDLPTELTDFDRLLTKYRPNPYRRGMFAALHKYNHRNWLVGDEAWGMSCFRNTLFLCRSAR